MTLAPTAALAFAETVVFGRAAMGETVAHGHFSDRWRIRRGGRLIFAENFRLDGAIAARLREAAIANGHAAIGTLLLVPGDDEMVAAVRAAAGGAAGAEGAEGRRAAAANSAFRHGTGSRWRGSPPPTARRCATISPSSCARSAAPPCRGCGRTDPMKWKQNLYSAHPRESGDPGLQTQDSE